MADQASSKATKTGKISLVSCWHLKASKRSLVLFRTTCKMGAELYVFFSRNNLPSVQDFWLFPHAPIHLLGATILVGKKSLFGSLHTGR